MISDKLLFTPGPLTTSYTVKSAMLRDLGSRDIEFINTVQSIRKDLLLLAETSKEEGYEAILMQGSGTFGIESVISSVIPNDGHLLVIINGAYGERISKIAAVHHIAQTRLVFEEDEWPSIQVIEHELMNNPDISHIIAVHCETTTGIINPVEEIGQLARHFGKSFIVDAMSSFGAVPLNIKEANINFLISSSNKCIEGVPGFSFIIARQEALLITEGKSRTLSLNLFDQWKGLEADGQFRFTPPTHALLAFRQALNELATEGGISERAKRYSGNHLRLVKGMSNLGFTEYLLPEKQGYIITSFYYPDHSAFSFKTFYQLLNERGQVIYPGKLSKTDCFRIGNIGRIFLDDIDDLLFNIKEVLLEMGVIVSNE